MTTPELVHDPEEYKRPLQPLRFLLGHFRGEGRYTQGSKTFSKEMIGSWEAGGRFIGLRMSVTYPLADGRKDIHHILIMLGTSTTAGQFTAHAFTDSGALLTYELEWSANTLSFADRPPASHSTNAQRARKSLTPTREGFEERLDVDWGDEAFAPYSIVAMRRIQKDV
ncbi:MAG: hypothetical protein AB7G75_14655 [Candidatus Binatia bacterium]